MTTQLLALLLLCTHKTSVDPSPLLYYVALGPPEFRGSLKGQGRGTCGVANVELSWEASLSWSLPLQAHTALSNKGAPVLRDSHVYNNCRQILAICSVLWWTPHTAHSQPHHVACWPVLLWYTVAPGRSTLLGLV